MNASSGSRVIRLAIPSKGRLREPVISLLEKAGVKILLKDENKLLSSPTSRPDIHAVFMRAEDIPIFVEVGAADVGITGLDLILEREADVEELLDLGVGAAEIVLAVSQESGVNSVGDLPDGARIATRYVNLARKLLGKLAPDKDFRIIEIGGAAEVMPMLGVADAIIDVRSTGVTLRTHSLKVVEVLLKSSARLIANRNLPEEKREAVEKLRLMLEGVLNAARKKMVMMNVPDRCLRRVVEIIPSMSGPTIAKVEAEEPMWEVYAVVDEDEVYDVVVEAKKRGARDIVILDIEKIVP